MKLGRITIIGAAGLILLGGGAAAAATLANGPIDSSGVIHGCYATKATSSGSHSLALQNVGTACPTGRTAITWNQKGPVGTPGVVSMSEYTPNNASTNTANTWAFLVDSMNTGGSPPLEAFADSNTGAEVTGTVKELSNNQDSPTGYLGVCYEPEGGASLTVTDSMPLYGGDPQTLSGVVGDLAAGHYYVGLCVESQSSNAINGNANVTVILAATSSGVQNGVHSSLGVIKQARLQRSR